MGAMIMLLVVVAQNVREQTFNPKPETTNNTSTLTVQEAETLSEKIAIQAEDTDWFAKNLIVAKQKAETELADYQAKLALAENETQKVKDELARLELLAQQLDTQTTASPEEVEHLKRLLAQQQRRKEKAELELAELQKEATQKAKSYAIIPYRGHNGTFRRPIYVECSNNKIIIQPEGVELVPGDFQALDRPDNPFDSVLRVVRQYYIETNQIVRGSEPYPLLIVRPSGVEMYETARQATGNWIKDFGYEIVNEDWNIQYPQPNDELRNRIVQQLELSRSRLSGYQVAMRMAEHASGYGGNAPQFRVDHRGNVMPAGGPMPSGEDFQRRLAANRQTAGETADGKWQTAGEQAGGQEMNEANRMPSPSAELAAAKNPEKAARDEVFDQQMNRGMRQMQTPSQRPQNWGLQGATQYSSGISRTVKIRCEADRFVLAAQAGLQAELAIPITDSVFTAADKLVQAVWEFQASWGSAGENMHWRPILQVRVSSGGEQRLSELKIHLKNSGLLIEE